MADDGLRRYHRASGAMAALMYGDDPRLIRAWNGYADEHDRCPIHEMGDFDSVLFGANPSKVMRAVCEEHFDPCDTWFSLGQDGVAWSYSGLRDSPLDPDDLADYCVRHGEDFKLPVIRAILAD